MFVLCLMYFLYLWRFMNITHIGFELLYNIVVPIEPQNYNKWGDQDSPCWSAHISHELLHFQLFIIWLMDAVFDASLDCYQRQIDPCIKQGCRAHYDPFLDHLISIGTCWAFWDYCWPFGTIWDHLEPFGTIWDQFGPIWNNSDYLWPFQTIWDNFGPF